MVTNPYGEVDRDTAMGMLEEMKRLCENDLAASIVEGDRVGAILNKETGNVTLPESFKKSYKAYVDGEWWRLDAPENAEVIDNRDDASMSTGKPLFDAKENFSGFWLIEAESIEVARKLAFSGSKACNRKVELRPLLG